MKISAAGPKYSFVVPVRNGEKTLAETLHSLLEQTSPDFEILVVDNASTDGTRAVARRFHGVRYVYCGKPGRSRARNRGAARARGEYLAFVDADVILDPDWLANVDRELARIPFDAIATRIEPIASRSSALDHYRHFFGHWKSQGTFLSVRSRRGAHPLINTAACAIAKSAFLRVGGFDESLRRHEDLELSLRLFARGFLLGGTAAARAAVRFETEAAGPFSRELAYLRRAYDVRRQALFSPPKIFDLSLLRGLLAHPARRRVLPYALLVEAARLLGNIGSARPPRSWRTVPGPALLRTSFRHAGRSYFLQPGTNFLFVDAAVYACVPGREPARLNRGSAAALRKICGGGTLSGSEAAALTRTALFSPAPLGY
jgi:glycosyltransferase involved in cell wall biosynthesis